MKRNQKLRKVFAASLAMVLSMSTFCGSFSGVTSVKAAEDPIITTTSHSYDFSANTGKIAPVLGGVLDKTNLETSGIVWYATEGNGVSFDPTQLKFRPGTTIYVPIQNDTSKITYTQACSGDSATRLTFVGGKGSAYTVAMAKTAQSVTISDITDLVKMENGQKYIPLYSNGDVKVTKMTLTEYNPINSVTVSGKVTNAVENSITQITFKNMDDPKASVVTADIDSSGNYTATLKRIEGNTSYVASVSKTGFKIDSQNGANLFALTGNSATSVVNFNVTTAEITKLSGTVTGIPDSFLKDTLKVKLVPSDNTLDSIYLNLNKVSDGNYTYSDAVISPDMAYSVVMENANDYEITTVINKSTGVFSDVILNATPKALQKVTGTFVTSNKTTATVGKVTFTNMNESGYSYTFDVTGSTYTANLRQGEYVTSAEVNGYTVFDHVSVKNVDLINDIYLEAPKDTSAVEYKAILNVGKGKDFDTITAAMNYIKRMTRTEEQRVTINLTDALYREQVTIDTPNVTMQSSSATAPIISWYYGIGYSYYSVAPATESNKGFYSEKYAIDKYTTTVVDTHWGTTVEVTANASGFRSENVTYESSFNRYMTTEEVVDGVGPGGDSAKINRSKATDADVKTTTNKERACTMYIQADNCEFNNCSFLSSQDTMFTGNGEESIYFKNCVIEGTTDFICGNGNPVFDSCTLSIYGYGNQAADGGFITASKAGGSMGYLFYNCKIVRTTYPGINTTTKNIYLGRPWGAGTKVLYFNTEAATADLVVAAGYASMSNVTPADAFYSEYKTHTPDGTLLDTSSRVSGTILLTEEQAKAVSVEAYFGDWKPLYYYGNQAADYTAVDAAIAKANGLTAADYVDFTGVTTAVNAVVRNYTVTDQAKVDGMAKAINDAIVALVKKPVAPVIIEKENTATGSNGQIFQIKLTADGGVIPADATLDSKIITSGSDFTLVQGAVNKDSKFVLFDLNVLNASGVKIQPDGSLKISMDVPQGYTIDKIKVYRIEANGSKTDMNATIQNGKAIFTVSHFSLYAIVDESASTVVVGDNTNTGNNNGNINVVTDSNGNNTTTVTETNTTDTTNVNSDVKTGDANMVWIYWMAMMLSCIAFGFIKVRNVRNI